MFEAKNFRGVRKDNFAKVFGTAYLCMITPQLILQAWEATGVFCQGYSLRLTGTRGLVGEGGVERIVDALWS